MKRKTGKNYYELLDVTPASGVEEIEEGYRQALKTYDRTDAVYSLYSKEEMESIAGEIKNAYETLRDPEKKHAYDSMILEEEDEETPEVDIRELFPAGRGPSAGAGIENVRNSVRLKRPFHLEAAGPIAEQYRILCSRIEEAGHRNNSKLFAVTSAVKGEGKSVTCMNAAYVMAAEFRKKTLLVECDMRKDSTIANNLEETGVMPGLADVLRGEKELIDAISRVEGTSLYVLPSGNAGKRASELLGSQSLRKVFASLRDGFDYVIIDCAPVLALVDMNIISRFADGVVFVVRAKKTGKDFVIRAAGSLKGVNIVGTVLNAADFKLRKYYY